MTELVGNALSVHTLLVAVLLYGFAPGFVLRLITLIYPRDDPRRAELIAELYAVPRIKRPFWVAEQIETAIFEGSVERFRNARGRRKGNRVILYSPTVEFLGSHTAFVGGVGVGKTRAMESLVHFSITCSALGPAVRGERLVGPGQIIFDVNGEYGGRLPEFAVIYKPRQDEAAGCSWTVESTRRAMKPDHTPAAHEIVDLLRVGRLVIVDLSAITQDARRACTGIIVGAILDDAIDRLSHGNQLNLIQIYFEEGHNLFRQGIGNDCLSLYDRLVREGRKLRIGICYTTQVAAYIPNSVLSNTRNFIDFPAKQPPRLFRTPPRHRSADPDD